MGGSSPQSKQYCPPSPFHRNRSFWHLLCWKARLWSSHTTYIDSTCSLYPGNKVKPESAGRDSARAHVLPHAGTTQRVRRSRHSSEQACLGSAWHLAHDHLSCAAVGAGAGAAVAAAA